MAKAGAVPSHRLGRFDWIISDLRKFRDHYPGWRFRYGLRETLEEIHEAIVRSAKSA